MQVMMNYSPGSYKRWLVAFSQSCLWKLLCSLIMAQLSRPLFYQNSQELRLSTEFWISTLSSPTCSNKQGWVTYFSSCVCLDRSTSISKYKQKPVMFLVVSRYRLQDATNISIPLFALFRLERWSHGESLKSRYHQNASMTIRWL